MSHTHHTDQNGTTNRPRQARSYWRYALYSLIITAPLAMIASWHIFNHLPNCGLQVILAMIEVVALYLVAAFVAWWFTDRRTRTRSHPTPNQSSKE